MFFFLGKVFETNVKGFYLHKDDWTDKEIRNYGVYHTMKHMTPPTLDGKLPEEALWKMNQPGHLRHTPHKFVNTAFASLILEDNPKVIEWVFIFLMLGWQLQHACVRTR